MDLFGGLQPPQMDMNGNPVPDMYGQGGFAQGYPQSYPPDMNGMMSYPQTYPQQMPSYQYNGAGYRQMQQYYPQGYGVQGYQMRKPSVSEIYRNLAQYVCSVTGTMPVNTIKLAETPQKMRHACVEAGISNLEKNLYCIPEFGITIEYYYCKSCCTLYVQGEVSF